LPKAAPKVSKVSQASPPSRQPSTKKVAQRKFFPNGKRPARKPLQSSRTTLRRTRRVLMPAQSRRSLPSWPGSSRKLATKTSQCTSEDCYRTAKAPSPAASANTSSSTIRTISSRRRDRKSLSFTSRSAPSEPSSVAAKRNRKGLEET
jgi:hypothetical protein